MGIKSGDKLWLIDAVTLCPLFSAAYIFAWISSQPYVAVCDPIRPRVTRGFKPCPTVTGFFRHFLNSSGHFNKLTSFTDFEIGKNRLSFQIPT